MNVANPACEADPAHQHHVHDVPVVLSGTVWGEVEADSLHQEERQWISGELKYRQRGRGYQRYGHLSREDAEAVANDLMGQGELLMSGGTDDDAYYARLGRACVAAAEKVYAAIDEVYR